MANRRVEWVVRQVEAWNSGDIEGFLSSIPPDFEFTPDPSFPDAGTYRGEEVREWIREWVRTWQDNRLEILGLTEHGRTVLMESRWHLAAPQSQEAIPVNDFSVVFSFDSDDRPTRMAAFFDHERAVEAAAEGTG